MKPRDPTPVVFEDALVRRLLHLEDMLGRGRPGAHYDRVEHDALAFVLAKSGTDVDAVKARARARNAEEPPRRRQIPEEPGWMRNRV